MPGLYRRVGVRGLLLWLALACVLAGCGGSVAGAGGGDGTASLWVTRDRGAQVVLTASVPSGVTALQALDLKADIETRYGGRFVQSVDGVSGSLASGADWFYFLNGIEAGVGATEVRVRPGDVVWWDFRSWRGTQEPPVVVGAFPDPFRQGWKGAHRPVEVRAPGSLAPQASALETLLRRGGPPDQGAAPNVFVLAVKAGVPGATLTASRGSGDGSPVTFRLTGSLAAVRAAARALVHDPSIVRYRYAARFDANGKVVG